MNNPRLTAFVMHIVLLIVFLGLVNMIFNLHRFAFIGNFLVLLVLLILALISVIGINSNFRWAWILLSALMALVFVDMVFVYYLSMPKPALFAPLLLATVAGFFISILSIEKLKEEMIGEKVEKTFTPGKYIASKSGIKFHAPKCDWAKKIKKSNAVWFDSKADAKKAGYKADACIK